MRPISPSQIKAYRTCPRRFTFRYIEGLKEPSSDAMEHGKAMHLQLENYVLRGQTPRHAHALSVIPHGPRPLTALAERKVVWPAAASYGHPLGPEPLPWDYLGIIDFTGVLLSLANMRLSPFMEPGAPVLFGDYKFTSNLKYALEVYKGLLVDRETLKVDPQSTMYADYFFQNGWTDITGKWIYTQTKGRTRTVPVVVRFERQAVDDAMGCIHDEASRIHKIYQIRPKANEVRYDRGGCMAFHKPCPHLSYCHLPRRSMISDDNEGDTQWSANESGEQDFVFAGGATTAKGSASAATSETGTRAKARQLFVELLIGRLETPRELGCYEGWLSTTEGRDCANRAATSLLLTGTLCSKLMEAGVESARAMEISKWITSSLSRAAAATTSGTSNPFAEPVTDVNRRNYEVFCMGFAEDFMRDFPGDPTDTPPVEGQDEAPPIPDEDMPEVPDGDEEAGRGISEEEQLTLINAELAKQRAERGTTERGFVNPSEAPETAPKTPEEAFERFGDPIVEKPKKEPARKFTAKDKKALLAVAVARGLAERDAKFTAAGLAKLLRENKIDPGEIVDADVAGKPSMPALYFPEANEVEDSPELPEEEPELPPLDIVGDRSELEKQLEAAMHADACDAPGAAEEVERLESLLADKELPDIGLVPDDFPGAEEVEKEAREREMAAIEDELDADVPTAEDVRVANEKVGREVGPDARDIQNRPRRAGEHIVRDTEAGTGHIIARTEDYGMTIEFVATGAGGRLPIADAVRLARVIVIAAEKALGCRIEL